MELPNPRAIRPDDWTKADIAEEKAMCDKAAAEHAQFAEDNERAARLADEHGFDGNLFRPLYEWRSLDDALRAIRRRIELIPRVIAAIEGAKSIHTIDRQAELLSVKDLAVVLGWKEKTVRAYNNDGLIPEPKRFNGTLFWRRREIEAWLECGCPGRGEWEAMRKGAA